jgi:RNA polymerase sigma-70 factor, ECF subfamily
MPEFPETRISLLRRLQNGQDETAWAEFHEIYRPVLTRMVASAGLPANDQQDVVQEIWIAVYKGIEKYEPRAHAFAFRGWLAKISRNTAINYLSRKTPQRTESLQIGSLLTDRNYQRQVLQWAALRVASRVSQTTFDAFWRTLVDGESVEKVAKELGMTPGALYVSRGRIMATLKREVESRDCAEE